MNIKITLTINLGDRILLKLKCQLTNVNPINANFFIIISERNWSKSTSLAKLMNIHNNAFINDKTS